MGAHFFGCEDCAQHFLAMFDGCSFGRCDLVPDDGLGIVLWIWRAHNAVTARVAREQKEKEPPPWPPRDDCSACWPSGTKWDEDALYAHLERSYWYQHWRTDSRADTGFFASLRFRLVLAA